MRFLRSVLFGFLLYGVLGVSNPAFAQVGTLTGRVTNSDNGQPVVGAQIMVLGAGPSTGAVANENGVFRLDLPAGTYDLAFSSIGYVPRRFEGIVVRAGATTTYDMRVTSQAVALDEVVVTASRSIGEKIVDAPATTVLIGRTEISERPATTPVDHLRTAAGVDVISEGIQSTNVVVRGFNNIFSGALHALTDYRLAGVPSLRVNLLHFIPANNDDIDRIEVVLGPGSALYGPNTANGVLHIFTRSPLDSSSVGTTVTLGGGERSVFQGSFRSSYLINRRLGVKVSGQYLRGHDWEYTDVGEQAARETADASPGVCLTGLLIRGYDQQTAQEACNRVGVRDFNLERWGMEARADYRFAEDGTAILTYGRTDATGIELTGLGAGQAGDWIYQFFQARMKKGRFFAQAYLNTSDAGNTWLLRDGVPLIDKSKLYVAQAQHGLSLFDGRQDFTYGVDFFWTRPNTEGSINGVYENQDNMDEWGVYLQSKTALSDQLDLILAGRVDDHSMLPDRVWSPRAGLVFKPTENQSFRFTYNRAFSTPTSLNFFLDISAGLAPNESLAALGYTVRAFGTGKDGYSFQNADGSLKGMRSPFLPGQFLPANPAAMWPLAMGVLQAQLDQGKLPPELGALLPVLAGLNPTANDLGIMLLNASTGALTPLESTIIPDVPGVRESNTETYEVGWQGILASKVRIAVDGYYTKKNNFISPLLITNPLLLLSGEDVGAFITAPVVGAIYDQIKNTYPGIPDAQALAQAQAQAAVVVPQLAAGIGSVPLGVAATGQIPSQEADLIVTYFNIGNVHYYGADLSFEWFLNENFTLNGSYSWVQKDWFPLKNAQPIGLNAPRNKGALALAYRSPASGFDAEIRARFHGRFPAESAGYTGTECRQSGNTGAYFGDRCVAGTSPAIVDLNAGYRLPSVPATLQLSATNLFNSPYRSFVGVPNIGRLAMLSVKYELF